MLLLQFKIDRVYALYGYRFVVMIFSWAKCWKGFKDASAFSNQDSLSFYLFYNNLATLVNEVMDASLGYEKASITSLFTKDKGTTFLVNSQIKIKALLLSQSNAFFVVNKIFRIIAE